MYKKNKDLIWGIVALALFACFVFALNRINQPERIILEFEETAKSKEQIFIANSLKEIDGLVDAQEAAIVRRTESTTTAVPVPVPVAGTALPVAWQSLPAPEADSIGLSDSLERSLAGSAELRTEPYINPSSDLNLRSIESLRAIREQRAQQ